MSEKEVPVKFTERTRRFQTLFGLLADDFLKALSDDKDEMEAVIVALQNAYAQFSAEVIAKTKLGSCPTGWVNCDGACLPDGSC